MSKKLIAQTFIRGNYRRKILFLRKIKNRKMKIPKVEALINDEPLYLYTYQKYINLFLIQL